MARKTRPPQSGARRAIGRVVGSRIVDIVGARFGVERGEVPKLVEGRLEGLPGVAVAQSVIAHATFSSPPDETGGA